MTSYSPVNVTGVRNEDGSATLVIGEVGETFRAGWELRLTLRPRTARLDQEIRIFNRRISPTLTTSGTTPPSRRGTAPRFIYPMSLATDHFGTTF